MEPRRPACATGHCAAPRTIPAARRETPRTGEIRPTFAMVRLRRRRPPPRRPVATGASILERSRARLVRSVRERDEETCTLAHPSPSSSPPPLQPALNKSQKDKVKRFASVADAPEDLALKILKEVKWDLEVGLEIFFSTPMDVGSRADASAIDAMFESYRSEDADEDVIDASGIERFCADLGIDAMDPVILVISCRMRAANMGVYTREEFRRGMRDVGVDATSKLRAPVPELREDLEDPDEFKEVYEYSFAFAKEDNHKSLALESACALWKVLLGGDDASGRARWALVDEWCDFLTEKHGKAITRDTWSQALEFSRSIGPELEGYDPAGAWPYLIDEFVEHKLEGKAAAAAGGGE